MITFKKFQRACVQLTLVWFLQMMTRNGLDINQSKGSGEDFKDIIFVTLGCQTLSLISVYFWWLWMLVPIVAFYKLWVGVIAPWIFAAPPEVDEKKQKKMERKMKRMNQPQYR